MATAASEKQRKLRMLNTFRAEVDADLKLPGRGNFYVAPANDKNPMECWPQRGGRKFRHFYIERADGTDHLISSINQRFTNLDVNTSVGPMNIYINKGYKEVEGDELVALVEMQQARTMAKLDEAVAAEEAANAVPVSAIEVVRGRRRSVNKRA